MFDHDRFDREFNAARRTHKRMFRMIVCFWLAIIGLSGWAVYELVSAGPDGIGNAIGRFIKSVEEGAR